MFYIHCIEYEKFKWKSMMMGIQPDRIAQLSSQHLNFFKLLPPSLYTTNSAQFFYFDQSLFFFSYAGMFSISFFFSSLSVVLRFLNRGAKFKSHIIFFVVWMVLRLQYNNSAAKWRNSIRVKGGHRLMAQCLVDIVVFCLGGKTQSHISKHSNSLKRAVII